MTTITLFIPGIPQSRGSKRAFPFKRRDCVMPRLKGHFGTGKTASAVAGGSGDGGRGCMMESLSDGQLLGLTRRPIRANVTHGQDRAGAAATATSASSSTGAAGGFAPRRPLF